MKKVFTLLAVCMLFLLPSCNKGAHFKNAASETLSMIPKDSPAVFVFNLESITEKLSSDKSQDLSSLLEDAMGAREFARIEMLVNEGTPLDFSMPAVFFFIDDEPVLTFYIRNEKEFRRMLDEDFDQEMHQRNGVWISSDNEIFQIDNQVWITDSYNDLDANDIRKLKELSEKQSFASLDVAQDLLDLNSDISLLVNFNELDKSDRDVAQLFMALNAAFDNPEYGCVTVDFLDEKIVGEIAVLDKKGKPAPCAFSLKEIDLKSLKDFEGKGDAFFALGINSDMMTNIISSFGNIMDYQSKEMLRSIDGTAVVALDLSDFQMNYRYSPGVELMISTKDNSSATQCINLIQELLGSSVPGLYASGNKIIYTDSDSRGMKISEVADKFDNAYSAAYVSTKNIPQINIISNYIPSAYYVCKPDGKGMSINVTADTQEGQNSLVTLFELIAKLRKTFDR